MAVAYQSSQTASDTTTTSVTVTKPTSTAEGDFLIGMFAADGAGKTVTKPSGWTTLYEVSDNNLTRGLYYLVAGASEPADYTWTVSSTSASLVGGIARITGQGDLPTVLLSNDDQSISQTSSTASLDTTVTPFTNTSNILMLFFIKDSAASPEDFTSYAIANDNPSWTEAYDEIQGDQRIAMAYSTGRTETTATGNSSVNVGDSGLTKSVFGYQVFLSQDKNVTISPSAIDLTASIQAPAITGGANISPSVIDINATVQAPTVTTEASKWKNTDRSEADPSILNEDKS